MSDDRTRSSLSVHYSRQSSRSAEIRSSSMEPSNRVQPQELMNSQQQCDMSPKMMSIQDRPRKSIKCIEAWPEPTKHDSSPTVPQYLKQLQVSKLMTLESTDHAGRVIKVEVVDEGEHQKRLWFLSWRLMLAVALGVTVTLAAALGIGAFFLGTSRNHSESSTAQGLSLTVTPSSEDQSAPLSEVAGVIAAYVQDRESFVHESRARTAIKSCLAKTMQGVHEDSVEIRGFRISPGRFLQQVPRSSMQLVEVDFAIVLGDGSGGKAQEVAEQLQSTSLETLSTQLSKEMATVGLKNSVQVTSLTKTAVIRATAAPGNQRLRQTTEIPPRINAFNVQAISTASTTPQPPMTLQPQPELHQPVGYRKPGNDKPCNKTKKPSHQGGERDETKSSRGKDMETSRQGTSSGMRNFSAGKAASFNDKRHGKDGEREETKTSRGKDMATRDGTSSGVQKDSAGKTAPNNDRHHGSSPMQKTPTEPMQVSSSKGVALGKGGKGKGGMSADDKVGLPSSSRTTSGMQRPQPGMEKEPPNKPVKSGKGQASGKNGK